MKPSLLQLDQRRRRDRLDLRHDQLRSFALDERAQRGAVEHVDHMRAMRDLHRRRVRIAIDRDHFAAEALQFDRDFLAELARAEQHHARADADSGVPRVVTVASLIDVIVSRES